MKLLIDECIGFGIYERIKPFLDAFTPPIQHMHMLEFNEKQGIEDDEWVPRAASEGWIVITGDSGRRKLGSPLQLMMPQYLVTGIYLSGKLQQKNAATKMQAIVSVLHLIPQVAASPRGTRFRLRMSGDERFVLALWPLSKGPPPADS